MSQGNRYLGSRRTSSEGRPSDVGGPVAGPEPRASRFGPQGSRRLVVGAVLSVGLVAAACGSSPSSAVANKTSATSKASTGATEPATTIRSVTNAMLGRILVSPAGATLYRFTADLNGQSTCTGACAQLWPPFTVAAGSQPTGVGGLVGVFGTSKRADGTTQVTYNGTPLYTFSGDKTAGSTAGQGVLGKWFVVNPSATPATPAAGPTATTAPAAGSTNTTTSQAGADPAITPGTAAPQPAATNPAPTSPPPTAPPATSPPPTSPPTTSPPATAPPAPTTTPTTMGYGY